MSIVASPPPISDTLAFRSFSAAPHSDMDSDLESENEAVEEEQSKRVVTSPPRLVASNFTPLASHVEERFASPSNSTSSPVHIGPLAGIAVDVTLHSLLHSESKKAHNNERAKSKMPVPPASVSRVDLSLPFSPEKEYQVHSQLPARPLTHRPTTEFEKQRAHQGFQRDNGLVNSRPLTAGVTTRKSSYLNEISKISRPSTAEKSLNQTHPSLFPERPRKPWVTISYFEDEGPNMISRQRVQQHQQFKQRQMQQQQQLQPQSIGGSSSVPSKPRTKSSQLPHPPIRYEYAPPKTSPQMSSRRLGSAGERRPLSSQQSSAQESSLEQTLRRFVLGDKVSVFRFGQDTSAIRRWARTVKPEQTKDWQSDRLYWEAKMIEAWKILRKDITVERERKDSIISETDEIGGGDASFWQAQIAKAKAGKKGEKIDLNGNNEEEEEDEDEIFATMGVHPIRTVICAELVRKWVDAANLPAASWAMQQVLAAIFSRSSSNFEVTSPETWGELWATVATHTLNENRTLKQKADELNFQKEIEVNSVLQRYTGVLSVVFARRKGYFVDFFNEWARFAKRSKYLKWCVKRARRRTQPLWILFENWRRFVLIQKKEGTERELDILRADSRWTLEEQLKELQRDKDTLSFRLEEMNQLVQESHEEIIRLRTQLVFEKQQRSNLVSSTVKIQNDF